MSSDSVHAAKGDFLGHPRGLSFLFATEMWERFSFYGMRALLVLYMVKYLLVADHGDVVGLAAVRGVLEGIFGPLGAHKTEPSTVTKMALGCFAVALSYLIMAGAAWSAGGGSATWLWLLAYFIVITVGELYLSPIGLSLVSKIAPVRMKSTVMGLWFGTSFVGSIVGGWLGSFWSSMDKLSFFIVIAAVAAGAGTVIWSFDRPLKGILHG